MPIRGLITSAIWEMFETIRKRRRSSSLAMGGDLEERGSRVVRRTKKRRVQLIAVVSGFCQRKFAEGHEVRPCRRQGRAEGARGQPVQVRCAQEVRRDVPATFGALGPAIKERTNRYCISGQVKEPVETNCSEVAEEY